MARCNSVMIMAGGTGGHVFPALAVADELLARNVNVTWLGTRKGIEAELVPAKQIPINFINVAGLRGTGIKRLLLAPVMLLQALFQALTVIRQCNPEVVVGLGGFASGPGGVAAKLLRKPLIIHEQNAIAGTTNRLLSKLANKVMVAFPNALPGSQVCGNPVRHEIANLPNPEQRFNRSEENPHLLVLGGSLGALAINQLVPGALARFSVDQRPVVIHQSGKKHVDVTRKAYLKAGVEAQVEPFIADMATAYGWADYVICRAGALTISELASAGIGSLLIPYPHAIDDHQTQNAYWLASQGAATLIQQSALTEDKLFDHLKTHLHDREKLLSLAIAARKLAKNDAAKVIADLCDEVCEEVCNG